MTKIIDTHAHYDDEAFDGDRGALLEKILSESVESVINIGCSMEACKKSLELAEKYPQIYAAVGIHPEDCGGLRPDYLLQLQKMTENPKVVAIGEIGLDYHYENFDKALQQRVFEEQLRLAAETGLPVIIHSRDATEDCLEILRRHRPKGVMHCFSGSAETAREILRLGMMISFTGVITFKNAKKAVSACEVIPADRIMLETDCPYMAPIPFRGQRCDSSMVHSTAEKVAEIKGFSADEMKKICNENARRFFGLANLSEI